ncbi:epidermal growth factor receptor substrate 15-like 1 isoform X2 [Cephus cinctus]|uniref:Epidermal growth factor receptor substrate 15-like 1 isoform X2 n=1 Tax=Cephus cinctus TaxID=211228 RepID=A0AAJ7BFX5_CEPCN|nr:epidermal growth factor receptor substrate 15-like 1 isoform X2 [Cephus cinctus]
MAALPSPTQVAGRHGAIYEAYYHQVDPNGYGRIGAMEAARFLKKSQLSDVILSKIWDMADPQSRGSLDKAGLFVALKLCALAQEGWDLNMANLNLETAPPKMGEIPKIPQKPNPPAAPVITSVSSGDWSIKPAERVKYDRLFDSLQPANGYIPGNKVKGVLMDSKLPLDTLGKIWDLADMDKDGMLDRHEFVVAMHLVYKALEKYAIPSVLPPELMPPGKRKESLVHQVPINESIAPPPIPPLPKTSVDSLVGLNTSKVLFDLPTNSRLRTSFNPDVLCIQQPPVAQQWVVSAEDQAAADKLFSQADMDMDGFVSGAEIKDVFLQSGLPQTVLAQIWGLCDICQSGKLNKEQFALSMWLIKQKLRGIEPPAVLSPDMMPPSLRKLTEGVVENNNISGYSNPELDMISKDIAELARERHSMEQDIAQKEADIKIKNGEIKSLQSELDTLAATLKQLENQKGEAQKRLNDLKAQVDKLRQQAEEQESVLRSQEEELHSKRQELEGLRLEEQQLEQQQNKSRDQLNELTKNLQDTQLQISQAKAKITHLEEQQRQMTDAITLYDSALAAGDATLVPDTSLQFNPEFEDPEFNTAETRSPTKLNGNADSEGVDPFASANGLTGESAGFGDHDPFASNQAKEAFNATGADPFSGSGGVFQSQATTGSFGTDPFASFNEGSITKGSTDPFDPFGDGTGKAQGSDAAPVASKDPFGDDPFANLHAPTRPESPSPALPPKKAKQPPPRPAPPRPTQGPTGLGPMRAAPAPPTPITTPTPSPTPDPFANANSADPFGAQNQPSTVDNNNGNATFGPSSGGFADFANFDSKPEPIPSRLVPPRPGSRPRGMTTPNPTPTPTPTPKLPDFTEDPFRDYRYEDPFNIMDPFAEDTTTTTEDNNANKKNTGKLDPFGFEAEFSDKDAFTKGFDSDFSTNTFPMASRTRADKNVSGKFEADFSKAFSDSNRNLKTFEADFANNFAPATTKSKTADIDEAFSGKADKVTKKSSLDLAHAIKDKLTFGDRKQKNNANSNNSNNNNHHNIGSKTWNGKIAVSAVELNEMQQIAWASQQSLQAEEERRRRKEQEEADLALALELSRQDKSGKI